MGRLSVLILAAGKGTRMKSGKAKVLHPVGGLPMLEHVVRAARKVSEDVSVVVGHQAEAVMAAMDGVDFVRQDRQLGTGHAVIAAKEAIRQAREVLILPGDVPLVNPAVLRAFLDFYRKGGFAGAVLTATLADPSGYGRIVRRSKHEIDRIVEHRDAGPEIREIREVNSAICAFSVPELLDALENLGTRNSQKEYYLTDAVGILAGRGSRIGAFETPDPAEMLGINSRVELAGVDRLLRLRKCEALMLSGVSIMDPETTWIDSDVRIGADSLLYPSVTIEGASVLAREVTVRSFTRITDSKIGRGSTILEGCVIEESEIHKQVQVGPSAHLRPGSVLEDRVRIGNFVEIKKSRIGKGTKAGHLSYLGDTETGRDVNVGAGTITCNYDGTRKHPTSIGDGVFIGSDSQLIAPVRIGKGAYVAAGSTITEDVPADALAIGRGRQVNKRNWARQKKTGKARGGKEE
jgi:bifunctional UDP-N-acetylglucosamine pyrophosphorylase/glucosamine-1-phosphate N-acetyltransferase